jgi:hypothetical protein
MRLKTREGTELSVSVRWHEHEPDGLISFRYKSGMLCSSYYLKTFQAIPEGEGLTLDGAYMEKRTLSPAMVKSCKRFIETCQSLRSVDSGS